MSSQNWLTALPVYNEAKYVIDVVDHVSKYSSEVLVVDDGSTDNTARLLDCQARDGFHGSLHVVRHRQNLGYGAALQSAFRFAIERGYELLVTIDCDGQHEPQRIPCFVDACQDVDIVSGSRYLRSFRGDSNAPSERRRINRLITEDLNRQLGLELTDAFCGFKAYRVESLSRLDFSENGYAMPLELWVQAVHHGFSIIERPVPLIYLDESRSFGGALDDSSTRLEYYRLVLDRSRTQVGWRTGSAVLCGDEIG